MRSCTSIRRTRLSRSKRGRLMKPICLRRIPLHYDARCHCLNNRALRSASAMAAGHDAPHRIEVMRAGTESVLGSMLTESVAIGIGGGRRIEADLVVPDRALGL